MVRKWYKMISNSIPFLFGTLCMFSKEKCKNLVFAGKLENFVVAEKATPWHYGINKYIYSVLIIRFDKKTDRPKTSQWSIKSAIVNLSTTTFSNLKKYYQKHFP